MRQNHLVVLAFLMVAATSVSAGNMFSWFAGKHSLTLVADGKPQASIVVAKEPTRAAVFAAAELQEHLRLITGAEVPVIGDDVPVQGVRILVGESAATRMLGLTSADFKPQEYLVQYRPGILILMGRDKSTPASLSASKVQVTGKPAWGEGRFGKALAFDGAHDAVEVNESGFMDASGSLEAWVKFNPGITNNNGTILRLDGSNPWTYHILDRSGNGVHYVVYDGTTGYSVTSAALSAGWHHLVATHDANSAKIELFVDGVSQGTAKYVTTTCGNNTLRIGGYPSVTGAPPGNPFVGSIDEVRIRTSLPTADMLRADQACTGDDRTTLLLPFDEGEGVPQPAGWTFQMSAKNAVAPGFFEEQATCYAVYDFLERDCGVRWFNPTDSGTVCPQTATLIVTGGKFRRAPDFTMRTGTMVDRLDAYDSSIGTLWPTDAPEFAAYEAAAYSELHAKYPDAGQYRTAKRRATERFLHRMRAGGEPNLCNHSFYGYYERFWRDGDNKTKLFVTKRPEFFAQGYPGEPPQLCYTNRALIEQVAQDARDYYDGKKTGAELGIFWNPRRPNLFPVEPMDNPSFCKCAECQQWLNTAEAKTGYFSNGRHSDYFFNFINEVAKELKKTHPGKGIITLAYMSHTAPPSRVTLDPSVAVHFCFACNRLVYDRKSYEHELEYLKAWGKESKKRPMYLWLYDTFPYEVAVGGRFNCFPGFFAHAAGEQVKLFYKYGYRGMFHCGYGQDVEGYITFKLMDDPTLDVDRLLDRYFSDLYGAAAGPMKALYLEIEKIYGDPRNYPPDVATGAKEEHTHQTEEIAWCWLGTAERMAKLAELMTAAQAAAKSPVEKKRVELFEKGIWNYMQAGRVKYQERMKIKASLPLPSATVPKIADAQGDPALVAWDKATVLAGWRTLQAGNPARRPVEVRLAHDGICLYLRFRETGDLKGLQSAPNIYSGDDWELFVAPVRGGNVYRQLGIGPDGKWEALLQEPLQPGRPWDTEAKVVSTLSPKQDEWMVQLALPLKNLLPGGVAPGQTFFANFYRGSPTAEALGWSPNFDRSFHLQSRLGELKLE